MTMFPVEDYPIDYRWLTQNEINWLLADFDEMGFLEACEKRDELVERGIYMEYDWAGHCEEWFLATRADAKKEFDYRCSCD